MRERRAGAGRLVRSQLPHKRERPHRIQADGGGGSGNDKDHLAGDFCVVAASIIGRDVGDSLGDLYGLFFVQEYLLSYSSLCQTA